MLPGASRLPFPTQKRYVGEFLLQKCKVAPDFGDETAKNWGLAGEPSSCRLDVRLKVGKPPSNREQKSLRLAALASRPFHGDGLRLHSPRWQFSIPSVTPSPGTATKVFTRS